MLTTCKTRTQLETLLEAATLAPSGDNTQPWRFEIHPESAQILAMLDETQDTSPMNAGQRMSRMALGAAVENIVQTCRQHAMSIQCGIAGDGTHVKIQLGELGENRIAVSQVVRERCTNRKIYNAAELPGECVSRLIEKTCPLENVDLHWLTSRVQITALADVIAKADQILFGLPLFRNAFLSNVRFDKEDSAKVDWGLSLGSLEVKPSERPAFRLFPRLPGWLLTVMRIGSAFAKKSRNLVMSSSGICLGASSRWGGSADVEMGRAMEQAWLTLTAEGLSVQPMMSLLVLINALENGTPEIRQQLPQKKIHALAADVQKICPGLGAAHLGFFLRFGFSAPPTARVGRRRWNPVHDGSPA